MRKPKDITNQRFGKLVALQRLRPSSAGYFWLCKCDCGNIHEATVGNLNSGHTTSCGCFKREATSKKFTTHGMSDSPEYESYQAAKKRCQLDPNNPDYGAYAGRGIEFHFDNFEHFYSVLGPRPQGTTLDRINNDGNYEPGNVRWATAKQQNSNTRRKRLEHFSREELLQELMRRENPSTIAP